MVALIPATDRRRSLEAHRDGCLGTPCHRPRCPRSAGSPAPASPGESPATVPRPPTRCPLGARPAYPHLLSRQAADKGLASRGRKIDSSSSASEGQLAFLPPPPWAVEPPPLGPHRGLRGPLLGPGRGLAWPLSGALLDPGLGGLLTGHVSATSRQGFRAAIFACRPSPSATASGRPESAEPLAAPACARIQVSAQRYYGQQVAATGIADESTGLRRSSRSWTAKNRVPGSGLRAAPSPPLAVSFRRESLLSGLGGGCDPMGLGHEVGGTAGEANNLRKTSQRMMAKAATPPRTATTGTTACAP